MIRQIEFQLEARSRGCHLVTGEILKRLSNLPQMGLLILFVKHTSCGLSINENADPDVRIDLAHILDRMVPEGEPYYEHTMEGLDDMPAHAKSSLVGVHSQSPLQTVASISALGKAYTCLSSATMAVRARLSPPYVLNPMMNVEDFRTFVLSLDDVEEKTPFGKFASGNESTLVFYVCGHMFCLCEIDDFTYVGVRSTAEEIAELEARYPSVAKPANPTLKLWRSLPLDGSIPQSVIEKSLRRAYEIIKQKYVPKKFKPKEQDVCH